MFFRPKQLALFFFFLLTTSVGLGQCISNVDFNTWTQEGDPSNGDWNVTGGGSQVQQNINGGPTFFVSPDKFINVVIEGSFETPGGDDDWVGFVFGYEKPVGNSDLFKHYRFDWKQANQACNTEGFSLSYADGDYADPVFNDDYTCHNTGPDHTMIDTQFGPAQGWADNTVYDFTLVYTTTRTVIMVDNDTIFDETGCYKPGRFGFYNHSQPDPIYSNFQYRLKSDFQILTPNTCAGDTADFLFADTSCTNITSTLDSVHWEFGDGTSDTALNPGHVYSSPGTYNVSLVVTDNQGCQDTVTKPIRIFENPTADFAGDTVCYGDTIAFADQSVMGDTAIQFWGWDFGDGNTSTVKDPQHSYASSGSYNVQHVVQDSIGCRDTATELLYQPPELQVSIVDTVHVGCFDSATGSATAQVSGGTPPYSYSWNTSPVQTDSTADSLEAGTYIVQVTDQEACVVSDTVTITEPPELVISSFNVDSVDCHGACDGEVSAFPSGGTVSGQYKFYWSGGIGGIKEAQPDSVCAGNYSLTIEDDSGCTVDTSFTMPQPNAFYTETGHDSAHCGKPDGAAFVDSVSGNSSPYSYLWDANTGNQTGDSATGLTPGSYDVTVTDDKGCDTVLTVNVPNIAGQTASIDTSVDVSCFGGSDGSATAQANGGVKPYSYQWNDPASQTGPTASGLTAGTYRVVVEDSVGCLDSVTVKIGEPSPVQVSSNSDTTICIGGTATLSASASGGTPGYTYHWDNGLGTGQTKNVSPGSNTIYQVYAEDNNGCTSAPVNVSVQLHPSLSITALSDDSICPGETAALSTIVSGGSGQGYTYSWSHGDTGPNTTVGPANTKTYTVTVEDDCSTPPATDSVEIVVNELPDVQFTGDDLEGCRPVKANFTNTTDPADVGGQCIWSFGNGTQAAGCGTVQQSFDQPGCHDVTLAVRSPEGCIDSSTKSNMVCVRPFPTADFEYDPKSTSVQDPEISFTNLSSGEVQQKWDFAGLDSSDEEHPSYSFPNDGGGTYDVCLKVLNQYGCADSVCRPVEIQGEFILYVPNAFTPDGDGVNDKFAPVVQGADPKHYTFIIYDRWGEEIFKTHHPEKMWDGKVDGSKPRKTAVYVWKLVTRNKYNGSEIVRQGHVTLVR